MKKFIEFTLGKASKFGIWDYAAFKICLISLGIILGAYFSHFFLSWISVIWAIFVLSYIYLIYIIFIKK